VFLTNETPGYLEYAGTPFARRYTIDRYGDDIERCRRLEVRETRHGFRVHNVRFERACDSVEWREASREFTMPLYQSSLEAVQYVKDYERDYFGAVAVDLEDQLEAQRIETGHELARMAHKGRPTRDIVDMDFNDGLTPEEALQLEKLRPIGFIGNDILAVDNHVKPVIEDSKASRHELARDLRRAIEALPPIPEKTCGWCGADIGGLDDHKIVDREPMCNPCVSQYFPDGIER
jgi:hypothetical protein